MKGLDSNRFRCGPYTISDVAERFWAKVRKGSGCWIWLASCGTKGYGQFGMRLPQGNRMIGSHRVSWELTYGPIPEGLDVLHQCDNPPCVRPSHLFLGNDLDNQRDRITKGRGGFGERNPMSKLKDPEREALRSLLPIHSDTKLAEIFGLSRSAVWRIRRTADQKL